MNKCQKNSIYKSIISFKIGFLFKSMIYFFINVFFVWKGANIIKASMPFLLYRILNPK